MADHKSDTREAKSRRAHELLTDPLLNEVLKGLTDRTIQEWADTQPTDTPLREFHWHRIRAIDSLLGALESVAADFAVASFNAKTKK